MLSTRRQKCTKALIDNGLDAVLFGTGANLQYIAETTEFFWQRSCMKNMPGYTTAYEIPEALAYLDKDGELTIVTIPRNRDCFPGCKVVVSYMDQMEDTLAPIVKGKKIGIGSDQNKWLTETLNAIDPSIETELAEEIWDDIRCIKDAKEIEHMKWMAEFTDEAVMHVVKNFREGMTMREAEDELMQYGFSHGIDDFSFPPTIGFKTRNQMPVEIPFDYDREQKLAKGTGIAFDIGFMHKGYCSDWGRSLYYGEAPEIVKEGYKALHHGQLNMISKIKPYETNINQLYGYVLEGVSEYGYQDYLRFRDSGGLGHQIGIDCHEHPLVNNGVDYVLKPGMIFCSEPKMIFYGIMYMRIEDMVLVTEDGAVSLSKFPRDMFEIGV
ncbi:MAG: aminopeptidase P family protein [Erysipelotrichaceae bacterium]|nr:aminopeptidase P family protein [Erysipelotrichaceae bacterium]